MYSPGAVFCDARDRDSIYTGHLHIRFTQHTSHKPAQQIVWDLVTIYILYFNKKGVKELSRLNTLTGKTGRTNPLR